MAKWILAFLFVSSSAMAAQSTVAVNADIFYKGEKRSSARIITALEQEAEITSTDDWGNSQNMKIFVQEIQKAGQKNQYKLDTVFKVIENGQEKFVSKPQIITLENEQSTIEVGSLNADPKAQPEFKLIVTIKKVE